MSLNLTREIRLTDVLLIGWSGSKEFIIHEMAGSTTIKQLFTLLTPLTVVSAMGVSMIGYGFVNPSQENNALQFIFGVPIALSGVAMHLLIFHLFKKNTLYTWIFEAIFVAIGWYQFRYVW